MRIIALEVEHFRAFRVKTRVQFGKRVAVVGGSASGKTSLLDAIDLVLTPRRGGAVSELDFSDQDVGSRKQPTTLRIEVTVGGLADLERAELGRFSERFEVADSNGVPKPVAQPEEMTAQNAVIRMALLATRDEETGEITEKVVYPGFKTAGNNEPPTVSDADRRAVGYLHLASPRRGPEALSWAWYSPLGRLLAAHGVRATDALRDLGRQLEAIGPTVLSSIGGLDGVRLELQRFIDTASPESGKLGFSIAPGTSRDLLRTVHPTLPSPSGTRQLPIDAWSQAERSVAALAVELALAKRLDSTIVALDEPELHLGPARQRHLVATLLENAGQVIVATQSPEVVRSFEISHLVATRRTVVGPVVWTPPIQPTDLRHVPARMAAVASALSARAAIVCEGIADQMVLEELSAGLDGFLNSSECVVVAAAGDDPFKLVTLLADLGVPVVFFGDGIPEERATALEGICSRGIPTILIRGGDVEALLLQTVDIAVLQAFCGELEKQWPLDAIESWDTVDEGRLRRSINRKMKSHRGAGRLQQLFVNVGGSVPRWLQACDALKSALHDTQRRHDASGFRETIYV